MTTRRALYSVLVFLLLVRGGCSAGRSESDNSDHEGASQKLAPSHRLVRHAAKVALHYLNYRRGSPHQIFALRVVTSASLKKIPGHGNEYNIHFTVEDEASNQVVGTCIGEVFFHTAKPHPSTNVNCKFERNQKNILDADRKFYEKMLKQEKPLVGQDIPDSFGHIDPSMEPVWHLAKMGSSFMMWKKSTEVLQYNMAQVKHVEQWKRTDNLIEFDFKILLHEIPTQEIIPCDMHLVWHPLQPLKVKYNCTHLPQEGSGMEQVAESTGGGIF